MSKIFNLMENQLEDQWSKLADKGSVEATIAALKNNNIDAHFVASGAEAKNKVLELIPQGSEVMASSSVTLQSVGLLAEIDESGKYVSIRKKVFSLDKNTQGKEMKLLRSVPDFAIGSVHAVTEQGQVLIASASGSQLPAYAYGANHVIWVVGTQKIVKDIDAGIKRIYEHSLPLETERVKKAYGWPSSSVNKILIFAKEALPLKGRTTLIFVNEVLGF